jgi:hypothetical protein
VTLLALGEYELMCHDYGIVPQSFLTDNGSAFTSCGFQTHLATFSQIIQFTGVHSNFHDDRLDLDVA